VPSITAARVAAAEYATSTSHVIGRLDKLYLQ
jgi:hypothetical protein